MPEKATNLYRWHLNPTLLQKSDFCNFIRDQIELFCETNCASSPNSFIFWDTLKAFLRGQILSYIKGIKKYMAEIEELEFQQSKSKEVHQLLVNKKLKYNTLHTYKIEINILKTKQGEGTQNLQKKTPEQ